MADAAMQPHPRLIPCDDRAVQSTNDDATISKGSAAAVGYVADPFVAHFLPRRPMAPTTAAAASSMRADALGLAIRRSPLINRGYYARMAAIRHLLRGFAQCCRTPEFQVLSLGAGFDTLPFCVLGEPREGDDDEQEVTRGGDVDLGVDGAGPRERERERRFFFCPYSFNRYVYLYA